MQIWTMRGLSRTFCSRLLVAYLGSASVSFGFFSSPDFAPRERELLPLFPEGRPFKLTPWVITPEFEREKSLAAVNTPGFAYGQGLLVLAYDREWVGAFSFPGKLPRWWFKGVGGLTAPPTIIGDGVYLGFRDGSIHKLKLATGEKEWSARVDGFPAREFAVHDNALIVVTSSQSLHRLDMLSGKTQWLFAGGSPEFLTIRTTARPTISHNTVFFGTAAGEVLGIDFHSGKEVLRYNPTAASAQFRDVVGPLAVLGEDKLLFSRSDGLVNCLYISGPKKGISCWDKSVQSDGITASFFAEDLLLTGSYNGYVTAYKPQNGQKLWQHALGDTVGFLEVVGKHVFSATTNGKISALTIEGRYLWSDHLEGLLGSPPRTIAGGLYYLTGQNVLYGYEVADIQRAFDPKSLKLR